MSPSIPRSQQQIPGNADFRAFRFGINDFKSHRVVSITVSIATSHDGVCVVISLCAVVWVCFGCYMAVGVRRGGGDCKHVV